MSFVSINGKTIPKIYVFAFIYTWTIIFGCGTQENPIRRHHQHPHLKVSQQRSMQFNKNQYRIYTATGKPVSLETIIYQIGLVHVVFLGEKHNDPVAHYLQEEILRHTTDRYWTNAYASKRRQIVLSMEMFARDVQMILDEYLFDIIDEHHYLSCARPWHNYLQDYHPLVLFARKNNLKVLAANAPRRYVHRVAHQGKQALNDLSSVAKTWIAPLPINPPSEKMKHNFQALLKDEELMKSAHKDISGDSHILDAQNLWDATMAYSIYEELSNTPNALILHLNGYFHTLSGSGIPEHLIHYQPDVKMIVINIIRNNSFPEFHPKLKDSGDYVIITDPNIRR
jgi:uncharacterized iron-regulated protein